MTSEQVWQGGSTPIVFLRPIGIAAGDAMRLMELAKRLRGDVRWRMAPPGVAADAYLVHRFSVVDREAMTTLPAGSVSSDWLASSAPTSSQSSHSGSSRKLSLDEHGWHRGRPVCILGKHVDTQGLDDDELAPLIFPEALKEMEQGLSKVFDELVGARMLYAVGSMAWEQRQKWQTHRLHAIESGRLVGVIDALQWQFFLLDGCSVERMMDADIVPMPRSGGFAAEGFHPFQLETALWEFAKRCPEPMLDQVLPHGYLNEPLTHRRAPHLKEAALGDHCVAILRALDTQSRTADELQNSLRLTRPSLMRALTSLALVRAIQPESRSQRSLLDHMGGLWARITGKAPQNSLF
ncbi:hypothetical protein [Variovorax sp. PCZ-1]|uniref:hypothetical protein n=1 Tax=Variovorax sp. PCZ-1 TaxID=2835533 RepID=UPI001BCE48BC|nr:hypothetical protein [Variovorax sp. PCZ-1]MBS7807981.1 hypothetical protein [Variovorax sp. PCZ-1]